MRNKNKQTCRDRKNVQERKRIEGLQEQKKTTLSKHRNMYLTCFGKYVFWGKCNKMFGLAGAPLASVNQYCCQYDNNMTIFVMECFFHLSF